MSRMLLVSTFPRAEELLRMVEPDLKGRTITYIPTAANAEKLGFLLKMERWYLKKLGLKTELLDIARAPYEKIKRTLEKNDYIFVSGGNTFYLLQEMRKSGADKIIAQELEKGKLYIGESAGSILVAPDISYIAPMDSIAMAPELKNYQGLHFTEFYVVPHYLNKVMGKAAEEIISQYENKLDLRILTDKQAVYLENGVEKKLCVDTIS